VERKRNTELVHLCSKLEIENRILRKYKVMLQRLRAKSR
jgi:hypothetical protein